MGMIGDALLVLRQAQGITQEELVERVDANMTQAALSRYENNLREPDDQAIAVLAQALGVTPEFLTYRFHMFGAVAADVHMRRRRTARATDWKRVEAELNVFRMHSSYLLNRIPLQSQNQLVSIDPADSTPEDAADIVRAAWRMPIGPVRSLYRWVEAAGIFVAEDDFGTSKIDGLSQWAGDHAVILVNSVQSTDRKRLTVAHEVGHLVMHGDYVADDIEAQANAFAAEFLMPKVVISPELNRLSLGKLSDLKAQWGVSMQALYERAYALGKVDSEARRKFYRMMAARGWKTKEPCSERIPPEKPVLAESIGARLSQAGLTSEEISKLVGVVSTVRSPFIPEPQRPRLMMV